MTCYTYNNKTYNESQLIELIIEKLDNDPQLVNLKAAVYKLNDDPVEILDKVEKEGAVAQEELKKSGGSLYISTTAFPSAKHYKNVRKDGTYEWFQFVPEYIAENRKDLYVKDHKDDPAFNGNIKAVEEAFDDMVLMESQNSSVGTFIHNLVHALLSDPKKLQGGEYLKIMAKLEHELTTNKDLLRAITENSGILEPIKEIPRIKLAIERQAQNIVNWILSGFNGAGKPGIKKIYSEMPMVLKNTAKTNLKYIDKNGALRDPKGIVGVADLIVIDNNNNIHLVDYKVCTRQYNEWFEAKKYDVEYLLAIYRAILNEAGIDGEKINMVIKPIFLPKGDILHMQEESSEELGVRADNINRISRIAWVGGTFTGNLRLLGIGNKPIYKNEELTGIKKDIEDDYQAIMGFKKDPKKITKDWFINNDKIVPDKDANGLIIGWKFWSTTAGTQGAWIKAATKEELIAEDGPLDEYIKELEVSRNSIAKTIIQEINDFKDPKKNITSFLHTDKNALRRELLTSVLGKYISEEWRCLNGTELPDIFTEYGILLFGKQDRATGETLVDVVCLSAFDLDLRVEINNLGTILGKYYTDEEAMRLPITPMNSMYKHVKAIEAMSVLNTVLKSQPEIFKNIHLNRFKVLNPAGLVTDNMSMNVDTLYENFLLLCDKDHGNIDAPLLSVPKLKTYEQCMVDLLDVLSQSGIDENLKDILKDIDNGSITLHAKKVKVMQLLLAMRNKYAKVRTINGSNGNASLDLNDPVVFCYVMLSQINNALHGILVLFDGRTNLYGIGFDEIFAFLGVTFLGKFKQVNNDGSLNSGLAGGSLLSSPSIILSKTLQLVSDFYSIVYGDTRQKFLLESNFVINLTKKYVLNFRSNTSAYFLNDNISIWERLLVHEADGSINPSLIIKNPYDNSNDLTELDREFLKQYLWEINKYRLDLPNLDRSWHYKDHAIEIDSDDAVQTARSESDSVYFLLPLARSDAFLRIATLSDYGIKNWFEAKWKDFEETTDPRRLHNERILQIKKDNDITEMYNNYKLSQHERMLLLENTANPYDFSLDLDFLACDIAFLTIRKETFDEALMLTETVLVAMSLIEQQTGADMSTEKDFLINLKNINLTGEPIQNLEMQRMTKTILIPREINSIVMLAFRPLQMLKELAYGMFVNFSRAWSLKYGSNLLSLKNVTRASGVVWGQKVTHKVEVLTGTSDIADFTLSEAVNRLYGIANEDLNRFAKNTSMSRTGRISNHSKWMYIAQSAPDYYNRMTLFIAKLMEDGAWEAHSLDENGNLIYDWKKDKRFDKLANYGLNSDYTGDPEYNKLKALYAKMCDEFEKGGAELKVWNKEKRRYEYGDIKQAYTAKQRDSIKEVADVAYGFYDHETKSQFNHKFLGLFFLQFQTFLSAKFNLLFKAPTARGGNTKLGRFVEVVRNGETYYDVAKINLETGELIEVQSIPESLLTEEQKRDCQPSMEWQGDFSEGLVWSVLYTIHDIFTLNWKEVVNNKQRLAQVCLAMYDLLLGIILVNILKAIFSKGSNKQQNIKPLQRVLTRSLEDVGPKAITQVSLTPSFFNTWTLLKNDGLKLFAGDNEVLRSFAKDFGATKDFIWEEN